MDHAGLLSVCLQVGAERVSPADQPLVPWWSFSKTVLAACALRLVAEGSLTLDAPISVPVPKTDQPYSLRQLLQHRAGIPSYEGLVPYHEAVARGEAAWTVEELLQRTTKSGGLDFVPGQGWSYSNVGYLFVRQMIESATGQDLDSSLRRLLFEPLGLHSVKVAQTADDLAGTAWGNPHHYDPKWVYHGLVIGTPFDAAQFLGHLLLGDMLPTELLACMKTPYSLGAGPLEGRPWRTTGYGLGLMIGAMEGAGLAIGHSGGGPGSASAVYHFPDRMQPSTIAVFARDGGVAEWEAVRMACALQAWGAGESSS